MSDERPSRTVSANPPIVQFCQRHRLVKNPNRPPHRQMRRLIQPTREQPAAHGKH